MKKNSIWFSLIEILVASIILSIWVFGIYKLISSNMNIISNNSNYLVENQLLIPFRECLKSIWYNSLSWSYSSWELFSINFWSDYKWCFTWSYNNDFSFSWVNLDNIDYYLYSKITAKDTQKINLELNIFSPSIWYLFNSWSSIQNLVIYK